MSCDDYAPAELRVSSHSNDSTMEGGIDTIYSPVEIVGASRNFLISSD